MLAKWTPARALVAEILDENLSRIESWFSSWNIGYSALIACPFLG